MSKPALVRSELLAKAALSKKVCKFRPKFGIQPSRFFHCFLARGLNGCEDRHHQVVAGNQHSSIASGELKNPSLPSFRR
jgi:hypothetical protein